MLARASYRFATKNSTVMIRYAVAAARKLRLFKDYKFTVTGNGAAGGRAASIGYNLKTYPRTTPAGCGSCGSQFATFTCLARPMTFSSHIP